TKASTCRSAATTGWRTKPSFQWKSSKCKPAINWWKKISSVSTTSTAASKLSNFTLARPTVAPEVHRILYESNTQRRKHKRCHTPHHRNFPVVPEPFQDE